MCCNGVIFQFRIKTFYQIESNHSKIICMENVCIFGRGNAGIMQPSVYHLWKLKCIVGDVVWTFKASSSYALSGSLIIIIIVRFTSWRIQSGSRYDTFCLYGGVSMCNHVTLLCWFPSNLPCVSSLLSPESHQDSACQATLFRCAHNSSAQAHNCSYKAAKSASAALTGSFGCVTGQMLRP